MMYPLTLDLLAWRWSTGLEHQPGPTDVAPRGCAMRMLDSASTGPPEAAISLPSRDMQEPQSDIPYDEPRTNPGRGITVVEVKNITCLKTHATGLAKRMADLTLIQEHAASDFEAARFKTDFRSQHRRT